MVIDGRAAAGIAIKQKHSPAKGQLVASSIILIPDLVSATFGQGPLTRRFRPSVSSRAGPVDIGPVGTNLVQVVIADTGPTGTDLCALDSVDADPVQSRLPVSLPRLTLARLTLAQLTLPVAQPTPARLTCQVGPADTGQAVGICR